MKNIPHSIKNIPQKIYLQIGDEVIDQPNATVDFNKLSGVCWYKKKVFDTDIEYVLNTPQQAAKDELLKEMAEAIQCMLNVREWEAGSAALTKYNQLKDK